MGTPGGVVIEATSVANKSIFQSRNEESLTKEGRFPNRPPLPDGGLETAAPWKEKRLMLAG
jgi:hypothetical protein